MGSHKVDDLYVVLLTESIDATDALFENGWVPRQVDVDDGGGSLQVQASATCVCGKEYSARWLVHEVVHQVLALLGWHATMQILETYSVLLQLLGDEASHAFPLAEYHHLLALLADDVTDDIDAFIHLGVISCLLIEDVAAIAYHSHLREEEQEALAVFIG